jgi:hypothetical protein
MRANWTGALMGALIGVAATSVALAVTSRNQTTEVRVDGLKDAIARLTVQVDKLNETVNELSTAVAKLGQ